MRSILIVLGTVLPLEVYAQTFAYIYQGKDLRPTTDADAKTIQKYDLKADLQPLAGQIEINSAALPGGQIESQKITFGEIGVPVGKIPMALPAWLTKFTLPILPSDPRDSFSFTITTDRSGRITSWDIIHENYYVKPWIGTTGDSSHIFEPGFDAPYVSYTVDYSAPPGSWSDPIVVE